MNRAEANAFRFRGDDAGHYESYFQRANHPTRPLAFWIRYTLFVPRGHAEQAEAELWAVYFDGEHKRVTAVKEVVPFAQASFAADALSVRIGSATLDGAGLLGEARTAQNRIAWKLTYSGESRPLLLLPERLYTAPLPKAKALVGTPLARFSGELTVDGTRIAIDDWVGSQNHNWGAKHTDRYAWGQVAGFDHAPDAFLECATASLKLGPLYTPPMSPMVLRLGDEELRLNALVTTLRARAKYGYFHWQLSSRDATCAMEAHFEAHAADFVALRYGNPPGGDKTCLNSKIARCTLIVSRPGKADLRLETRHRAAFEILTDDTQHGVRRLDA